MITQNNIKNLYNIAANLAFIDYRIANPKGKYKKRHPSGSSYDQEEAQEYYELALKRENISRDEEEIVKAYLLRIRRTREDLLADNREFASTH